MVENLISLLTSNELPRLVVLFFGVFLFVWLFRLGFNLIVRWFDKI